MTTSSIVCSQLSSAPLVDLSPLNVQSMTSSYRPSLHQQRPPPTNPSTFLDGGSYLPPSSCPPGTIDPRYQKPGGDGHPQQPSMAGGQLRRLAMTGVHSRLALSDFQAVLRAQGEANNPYGTIPKMESSAPSPGLKVATYAALEQFRCNNGVGDSRLSSAPASSYGPFSPIASSTSGATIDGHPYVSNGHLAGYPDEHVTSVSKA